VLAPPGDWIHHPWGGSPRFFSGSVLQSLAEVEQEELLQQPAPLVTGDLGERLPVTSLISWWS